MYAKTILSPEPWEDYELLDTGGFEKLERFGEVVVARPEPQAIWDKSLPHDQWVEKAHAIFAKAPGNPEKGSWKFNKKVPSSWKISYKNQHGLDLRLKLALTSFKHVGIFPEQAVNWDFIHKQSSRDSQVLNLFAYTGAASLAANASGATVTHLDAVKPVVTWARENMENSGQSNIRWVVDDAVKFVKRELRRGNTYQGIILDPPAYGRGPNGEKWVLEEQINALIKDCSELLAPDSHFFVLNMYSLSLSSMIAENLVKAHFSSIQQLEHGELYLTDNFGKRLPLGIFLRFWK
ncbi:class I SAM-dependent methyltransferase [Pleomorphovibrio marinus]|uniref:class I SAM-dependent methyltransferase n=1 Tax=Pleomorphovibrio marinus TaxID=2164132 RepID=UPI000E0BA8B1|nr:class I SAM-dependent methyltransferase [Pleomorphovibrio marinus]